MSFYLFKFIFCTNLIFEICFEVYDNTPSFYLYDLMKEFIFRFFKFTLTYNIYLSQLSTRKNGSEKHEIDRLW